MNPNSLGSFVWLPKKFVWFEMEDKRISVSSPKSLTPAYGDKASPPRTLLVPGGSVLLEGALIIFGVSIQPPSIRSSVHLPNRPHLMNCGPASVSRLICIATRASLASPVCKFVMSRVNLLGVHSSATWPHDPGTWDLMGLGPAASPIWEIQLEARKPKWMLA
jgi:hypothetical protein